MEQAARPRLAGVCGEGGWEGGRREEPEETLSFFSLQSLRLRTDAVCGKKEWPGEGGLIAFCSVWGVLRASGGPGQEKADARSCISWGGRAAAQVVRIACGFPPPGLTGRLLPWALGGDCGCQAAVIPVPLASEQFSS